MNSLIRASNVWGYSELVRELGGDPVAMMERFHVPPDVETREDAFVPFESMVRLIEASAVELDCPDFGLRLSRWQGLDILGPIAVIARNATKVLDGLEAVARYLHVHSPALRFDVAPTLHAGTVRFTFEMRELSLPLLRQSYELAIANGAGIARLLSGVATPLASVSFLHEQVAPAVSYEQTFGCPVHFGCDWCGFEVPLALTTKVIDSADPETRKIATRYLEAEYQPVDAPLDRRVTDLIRRLLPTGHCTTAVIAEQLALQPRTLQRRLHDVGVECQDLIDHQRRELALGYLAEPRLHLHQIAGLLGYSEQSSLNRSCRRWFDKTPRQVRHDLRT